jgi:translation initiation factor IF-1
LLRVTEESLYKAIDCVRSGARISDIGHAVQRHVEAFGFSVVREFVGHGIGEKDARRAAGAQLRRAGPRGRGWLREWCSRFEPMVNAANTAVKVLGDGVDGRHARWQPVGSLRAYGGGHSGRAVDSDGERSGGDGPAIAAVSGVVAELLPSGLYRVRLDEGVQIVAHIADRIERNFIRVLVGDSSTGGVVADRSSPRPNR